MIFGVGCDIIDVQSVKKMNWSCDEKVRNRIFSNKELDEYCNKGFSLNYLMGRFAVKESVVKCLGFGLIDGISLLEIETLTNDNGKPVLLVFGKVKELSVSLNISNWQCSISHTDQYSMAFVVAESFL